MVAALKRPVSPDYSNRLLEGMRIWKKGGHGLKDSWNPTNKTGMLIN
jgi:hypothetical protein